jgi:hypothetical protein
MNARGIVISRPSPRRIWTDASRKEQNMNIHFAQLAAAALAAIAFVRTVHADPTITCGPSPIVVSEKFNCTISVAMTGLAPNTPYTVTASANNGDVLINGGPGPSSQSFTTAASQTTHSTTFDVRSSGAQANGGFVTITLTPPGNVTCSVQVICKPAVTTGPGNITLEKKNNSCTTFDLTLQAMGCVTGKQMKPTVSPALSCVTVTPDPATIVPTQAQAANGKATFTVCCNDGLASKTVQVTYSIDPPEPLSDSYNYSHTVVCTKECPTKAEGQNGAKGSGPMDGYIAPDVPGPDFTRVSFDMLGVDFAIVPGNAFMFFYGTPTGINTFAAQATLEEVQIGQVHVDQPSELLTPFFNGEWLDYFVMSKDGEVLFVSVPKPCDAPCPADLNNSGGVDVDDLFTIISSWGPCEDCPADLNGTGAVEIDDLFTVLGAWGPCDLS